MRVGELVRIKEISGTKLASKRKPLWGVIDHTLIRNEMCTVTMLRDLDWGERRYRSKQRVLLSRRCFDYPTDKQVPDWVWVELAKRALLTEGENT